MCSMSQNTPLRKIDRLGYRPLICSTVHTFVKFVQFDWLTQIFRRKKNFEVENFQLYNDDIFGKFSVRGKFS